MISSVPIQIFGVTVSPKIVTLRIATISAEPQAIG